VTEFAATVEAFSRASLDRGDVLSQVVLHPAGTRPGSRRRLTMPLSLALAASSGFTWFANWEVVSPESPT
jgi:hypothetical protein